MREIDGYLLTEQEAQACLALLKKMRGNFQINFDGSVKIKANSEEEASDTFWRWVSDIQDYTYTNWYGVILEFPHFNEKIEERGE